MAPCRKGKQICFHRDYGCGRLVSLSAQSGGFVAQHGVWCLRRQSIEIVTWGMYAA
jgi:hypothetical protein